MSLKKICENISYIPASEPPLSADTVFIKDGECTWIFDTGSSGESAEAVNGIQGTKNIVLSHFHPDHIANIIRVKYDSLFVSRNTFRYVRSGTIIEEKQTYGGVTIIPLPSSHAKGSLALVYGDYAFLGDGTYAHIKTAGRTYNVQLLKAEIELLKSLPVKYFCISHARRFVQNKETIISLLESIYQSRKPGETEISVENLFRP